MYDAVPDPYCYPGTTVLKNLLDVQDQHTLNELEAALGATHYAAIHRHLFQDACVKIPSPALP